MIRAIFLLIASSVQAFEFSNTTPCNESEVSVGKPYKWCVEGHFPANQKVTFLERSECHAVTARHITIRSSIDESEGTELVNFKCATAESGDKVVLGVDVKKYRKLAITFLATSKFPKGIDSRIRASTAFLKLINKSEPRPDFTKALKLHLYEFERNPADPRAYLAVYKSDGHEDQIQFLVTNKVIQGITDDYWECPGPPSAFRLNGSDFFEVHTCTCGTDGCGYSYYGIPK